MSDRIAAMTLRLERKVHKALKILAVEKETTVTDLVTDAINQLLRRNGRLGKGS